MIWLDWALLALLVAAAFAGWRVGIIGAGMALGGLLTGWYFAGQVSAAAVLAVEAYTDSTSVHAVVSVLIYVALLVLVLYAAGRVLRLLKPLLSMVTLGMSAVIDRLGGMALGFVVGLMLIGAVVLIGARLTYQIDLSALEGDVRGQVMERVKDEGKVQQDLERLLSASEVVGAVVQLAVALPGDALGLAPAGYGASLELLQEVLD